MKSTFLLIALFVFSFSIHGQSLTENQVLMASKRVESFRVTNLKKITLPHADQSEKNITDCRMNILKVMCLAEPKAAGDDENQKRPCLKGGEQYAHFFEELYDNYPPLLQKMFCSLKVIYIEKKFDGTAWAGTIVDDNGNLVGAQMGIRKSVLDENIGLTLWASWKEQLSFGGATDSYTLTKGLPFIQTASGSNLNDFLYFVVAHEFGHIFDFANNINKTESCDDETDDNHYPECRMHKDSWGAISWITDKKPKPSSDFANRSGLCFYWCRDNPLGLDIVSNLYKDLGKTNFISIYATRQPWDDFAESLAYFVMSKYLSTSYEVNTAQGNIYNIVNKITSNSFDPKYRYLENFINRGDIIYP